MRTILWATSERLRDFLFLVNRPLHQEAKSRQVEEVLLGSSAQAMEVVDKEAVRTGQYLQWKTWAWLLVNTESM